jgi:mRNA interferase RelE/StbE
VVVRVADYSLVIARSARKELDALDEPLFARTDRKILAPAEDPRPPGAKKLKGYKDFWRVRIGDWRVVYIVDDPGKLVTVTRIAHRREVYKP